jgi:hypothetical protein
MPFLKPSHPKNRPLLDREQSVEHGSGELHRRELRRAPHLRDRPCADIEAGAGYSGP